MPITVPQAAVIATHNGRVCMVTSSSGRRWVIPKGQIDPGHTPGQAALQEAWEEAGLLGTLDPEPVGSYVYEKFGRDHLVLVYRMNVLDVRDQWPERSLRQRAWLSADNAIDRVEEPGLREIFRRVFTLRHPDRIAVA